MDDKDYVFAQFQYVSNKLKKRRILKKPNFAEASQQFESLGITCEADDLPQYAGLCYQAAANCQESLGNSSEQAYLLLKGSRQYMSSYLRLINHKMVYTDENLHEALVCYKGCLNSYTNIQDPSAPNVNMLLAGISLEMGDIMRSGVGNTGAAIAEYQKTLKLLELSPFEKISCLQRLISATIELGDYDSSLRYTNEFVEEAQKIPLSGFKEDVLQSSEITRILLLLILQPTPQQISPLAASILEKYAWVETVDNNEIGDLELTLKDKGVSVVDQKLFLCLQSLVMACQYGDRDCLVTLEDELLRYLNCEQKHLLRTLMKQKLRK